MKVLRLLLYQETVCYTKPFASKVTETYPLPPYSTVKGMLHEVMEAKQLIPFSLSIQGKSDSRIVDYRKTHMIKKHEFAMPIIMDGLGSAVPHYSDNVMTSMPLYTHMLYDVELVVHIKAEDQILQKIYTSFKETEKHLSLGRHEDLLRLDEVSFVKLNDEMNIRTKMPMYAPRHYFVEHGGELDISGVPYRLNWTYTIKNGVREWQKIPVIYIPEKTPLDDELMAIPFGVDPDGYTVMWNE